MLTVHIHQEDQFKTEREELTNARVPQEDQIKAKREEFMRMAIQASAETMRNGEGGPFGTVITRNNEIIAVGANLCISHCDLTAHAEIVTIRKASQKLTTWTLEDCELYTSCEPCSMCLGAIHAAGIKKVYYGNTLKDCADIGIEVSVIDDRTYPMEQLLYEEARVIFDEFKRGRNPAPTN